MVDVINTVMLTVD